MFLEQLLKLFISGTYITVDEQLASFHRRWPYCQFMPNKPAKYRINIMVMRCQYISSAGWWILHWTSTRMSARDQSRCSQSHGKAIDEKLASVRKKRSYW